MREAPQELCFTLCVCARGVNMLLLLDKVTGSSRGRLQPHLPQPGDAFDYGKLHVTVQRVARRRVEQVRISRNPKPAKAS